MGVVGYIDHAVLKPDMTRQEAREAIQLGIDVGVRTVCVRGCDIEMALEMCKGTATGVSCVLDFPYGYGGETAKRLMAAAYSDLGVEEIDMVMNYGYAKGGDWDVVQREISAVVEEAHKRNVVVKVIFETSQLTLDQIRKATEVSIEAGADFVKTSTGFNGGGATAEAVEMMIKTAAGRAKVKPSGGIRNLKTAQMYLDMGAERLGVGVSGSVDIANEEKNMSGLSLSGKAVQVSEQTAVKDAEEY